MPLSRIIRSIGKGARFVIAGAWLVGMLAVAALGPCTFALSEAADETARQEVILTLASWRPQEIKQMNRIFSRFHAHFPRIAVRYDPIDAPEYNAVMKAQLETGTGPDLFYLRSYSTSRMQHARGYLEPLGDIPGLVENYTPQMRAAWTSQDGVPYGVPFIATSHGIYYNQDIFKKLGLRAPDTHEELLAAAKVIRNARIIPFANTSGEGWAVAEIVFMNLAPSFIGGREGRMAYLSGGRCFNDSRVVAAFQAVRDLAPFFPENHDLMTYSDSLQLFAQGKAAMFMGGSWEIPYFEATASAFSWSVFATPPPAGSPGHVTFHLDVGIGLNAASSHKVEARRLLEWMTSRECAELLGNELPGFFPMHRDIPPLANAHANAFLALNRGRGTDVRFAWENLRDGSPDGYDLMRDGALAVLRGERTPQEAANALQAGLARWYEPARRCGESGPARLP